MHFLGTYEAQYSFFSRKMPEKSTREAGLKAVMPSFQPRKETHLQAKAYLYISHLEALFSLYFLYKGCFCHLNGLFMWVGAYRQR